MSKKEELQKLTSNEIQIYNVTMANISEVMKFVPNIEDRKKEAEVRLDAIERTPEDIMEEKWNELILIQKDNLDQINKSFPKITYPENMLHPIYNSSGTASVYTSMYKNIYDTNPVEYDWIKQILENFDKLNDDRIQKRDIPQKLDRINSKLGEQFIIASNSYDKANNRVNNVCDAAMEMRNFLSQLWGGLVEYGRIKTGKQLKHKEFKIEADRQIISNCLVEDIENKKLFDKLNSAYKLFTELSGSDFGKNNLSTDIDRLKGDHTVWLSLIIDIVDLLG